MALPRPRCRWIKQRMLLMALRLIFLTSLLTLKAAVPVQGQGDGMADSTCACLEQSTINSTSNVSNCTLSAVPGRPDSLEYHFREIATEPRHAELTLSWTRPENYSSLCYYELRIRGTTGDRGCQITEDVILTITKESTNLTLTTAALFKANSTLSLLYECRYQLTISSFPGNESITEDVYIRHSRAKLFIDCFANYNPENVKYDIFTNWTISDPLATEAASVNGYRVRLSVFPGLIYTIEEELKDNSYHFRNQIVLSGSPGIYLIEVEVRCLSNDFGTPFFWRTPLMPHRCNQNDQCKVMAPPQPPSLLDSIQVDQAAYFLDEDTLSLVISWRMPMYPNGILKHYQLRIGTVPILPQENSQEAGITILTRTAIGATETSLSLDIIFENKDSNEIYIQMRSVNNYSLYSNWSTPVIVNLSDISITAPPVPSLLQPQNQFPTYAYALIGVALLALLAVLIVTMYLCISYVRKHYFVDMGPDHEVMPMGSVFGRTTNDRGSMFAHVNYSRIRVDEWEIPETEITVFKDQPLGEGCFGKVYKGLLMGHSLQNRPRGNFRPPIFSVTCPVAIKQLKSDALGSEKENFFKEMKMMKMVSSADNEMKKFVVNLVGCITIKEPLLLVVEYVRHGDLQSFLRTIKKQTVVRALKQQRDAAPYLEPQGVYSELNPGSERYADLGAIEEKNLLEFARQIAAGMEFLAGLGVIHRDLACRNILIGDQKNLKISDFGMSRYLPKDEVYVPMSHGLLPLRWMAIESIHAREFTTASDVWAYGVVLWELCTMCDFPYKSIANHDILGFLRQGYRMPKPTNCSIEVYEVILRCWREQQQDRPTFPELRSLFDQFLTAYVQDHYPYIELQSSNIYERLVPETGQVSNEFDNLLNGSDNDSVHDLRTAGLLEDQVSLGIGGASPSKGGLLSEPNGGMSHLSPHPQHDMNRLSMLSDRSVQLLRLSSSNLELCSNSSSVNQLDIIGRQGIQSLPTESGARGSFRSLNESEFVDLRYVESPVVGLSHSSTTMTSDLSLDGPERKFTKLKSTNSFPDCSQSNDGGSSVNSEGEIRSSSFSTHQKNTSKK